MVHSVSSARRKQSTRRLHAYQTAIAEIPKKKKIERDEDRRQRRLPRTFFAVDAREARLADAVVASHAVGTHASVLAGLVGALVSI